MAQLNTFILFILWMIIIMIGTSNTVQGSHRDSTKQNKDLAGLNTATSSNLNNPSAGAAKNTAVTTADSSDVNKSGPYFDVAASRNVTALLGKTAYLTCRVKNLGNKTMLFQVSWVRHRDIHLLTVGRYTYTSDQRFKAINQPHTEDWILQIKYPQHRDSGIYECQVSTTPHMSHFIHLNVVEPTAEIIGAPDLYIESGSTINLTCVVHNSPEPPAYIFWNHNHAIISYDSPRGGVSVITEKGETSTSFLLIQNARPSDSGSYQCNPSSAKPRSVTVHVLNGASHSVSRGVPSSNPARGAMSSHASIAALSLPLYIGIIFHVLLYHCFHKSLLSLLRELCESTEQVLLLAQINFYWKSTRFFLIGDNARLNIDKFIERRARLDENGAVACAVRCTTQRVRRDDECRWRINSSSNECVDVDEWAADYIRNHPDDHRHRPCLSDTQVWIYSPEQISSSFYSYDNKAKSNSNNNMSENDSIVSHALNGVGQSAKTRDTHQTFTTNYDIIR